MKLSAGTRLGPYQIEAPLGAGGMGEVYRAKDTRLGRTVAIKILGATMRLSAETEKRFQTEAKAISQLQHANICTLYDIGRHEDTDYLVMEYLEGKSLADVLQRGPLPLEQALQFGQQIASALEVAHRRGIVHRDLKPANILVTGSGAKLLDFGLAKFRGGPQSVGSGAVTQTSSDLTEEGKVMGTLPYMAPEVLEGQEADARSDLWALGCVLYEMVSGVRAFQAPSQASLLTMILTLQPRSFSELQANVPPALERIIAMCLAKNPEKRWQNARDVELQLQPEGILSVTAPPEAGVPGLEKRNYTVPIAIAFAVISAALALFAWRSAWPSVSQVPQEVRFQVNPPPGHEFLLSYFRSIAVSPDGTSVAFAAMDTSSGRAQAWIRPVSGFNATPIPGTEGANSLIWSPDGKSLAFFGSGKLKRVDMPGGTAIPICDVPAWGMYAGTWSTKGEIVFGTIVGEALYSVPSTGGESNVILRPDPSLGQDVIRWPLFLPDGKGLLYLARGGKEKGVLMLHEPGRADREIMPLWSQFDFLTPETLVFVKDGALLAQGFDWQKRQLKGSSVPVAPAVDYFRSNGWAAFGAFHGTVVYTTERDRARLLWLDRAGRSRRFLSQPGKYANIAYSFDGRTLVFDRARPDQGTLDLWTLDLDRNVETQISFEQDTETAGLLLPDGEGLVYAANQSGLPRLMRSNLKSGKEEFLTSAPGFQFPLDISRNGQSLLYTERNTKEGKWDIRILPLTGSGSRSPVDFSKGVSAKFSPDGLYVAFISTEFGGSPEAYVAPVASPEERVRLSRNGANLIRWCHSSQEIFYVSRDGKLIVQPVATQPALKLGTPQAVLPSESPERWVDFDVAPDGQSLVAIVTESGEGAAPASVIVGFAPKQKTP